MRPIPRRLNGDRGAVHPVQGRAALVLFRELSADGALTGCPFA
jgi:hypothetical protein